MNRNFGGSQMEADVLRVVHGTAVMFVGGIVARMLGMLGRVLVARHFGLHEFGVLGLGLSAVAVAQLFASFGLGSSVPRFVAYHRGRGDAEGLRGVLYSALLFGAGTGLVVWAALSLGAGWVADAMNTPELRNVVRVLAIAVPFTIVTSVLLSAFRGFDRTREHLVFEAILANVLKFGFLLAAVVAGAPLVWAAAAYTFASVTEAVVVAVYARTHLAVYFGSAAGDVRWAAGGKVIRFSVPLFGSDLLGVGTRQATPLLLGAFLAPAAVGLYNVATLLLALVGLLYGAMKFLYMPVSARLAAGEEFDSIRGLYSTATKWVAGITFPVVAVLMIFPVPVLVALFGREFQQAALVLRILVITYFVAVWVGPNGVALLAVGHPRRVFWGTALAGLTSVGLSLLLVPRWGLTGAALASGGATLVSTVFLSASLYRLVAVHPFTIGFIKVTLLMVAILALGIGLDLDAARAPALLLLPLVSVVLSVLTFAGIWLLGGVDEFDRKLLMTVWGRLRSAPL